MGIPFLYVIGLSDFPLLTVSGYYYDKPPHNVSRDHMSVCLTYAVGVVIDNEQ